MNFQEALKIISCPEFKKIKGYYTQLSLDQELEEKPELAEYLRAAI